MNKENFIKVGTALNATAEIVEKNKAMAEEFTALSKNIKEQSNLLDGILSQYKFKGGAL